MNSTAPSNWKPAPVTGRLSHIDALRGIAVILMIQQHMLAWLWNAPRLTFPDLVRAYPLSMGMNLLGNLAAPLFITLAGMGAGLFLDRSGARGRTLVMRGACIILLGLALNLLAPYWFNPGTWYVLHLIGLCLMISPALVRSPSLLLGALCMGSFVATPLVQTWLSTPIYLPEVRLNDTSFPGGVVRLAMAEGHFPVLPWMALFILGIIAHRLAKPEKPACALAPAAGLIAAGATLALLYRHGYAFATYGPLYRAFVFAPYFFPPHPPLMLVLAGMALFCVITTGHAGRKVSGIITRFFSRFGRASLTLFFAHVVLINTFGHAVGFYRSLSPASTWIVILFFLLLSGAVLIPWDGYNLRYGLEWLVRLPESRIEKSVAGKRSQNK